MTAVAKMVWDAGGGGPAAQPVTVAPPVAQATTVPTDLFTFGLPTGYTQKDLGDGRYEMFDATGQSAGFNYKGVRDAIGDLSYQNARNSTRNSNVDAWMAANPNATPEQIYEAAAKYGVPDYLIDSSYGLKPGSAAAWVKERNLKPLTASDGFLNDKATWTNSRLSVAKSIWQDSLTGNEVDPTGYQQVDDWETGQTRFLKPTSDANGEGQPVYDTIYAKQGEKWVAQEFGSQADLDGLLQKYKTPGYYGGVMGDWEALGQVLDGNVAPDTNSLGSLPTDNRSQKITGTGMLYGSTPVFSQDGKLIGYRTDLTPNETNEFGNGGPDKTVNQDFGTFITHKGKSHSWNNANWRELDDPEAWKKNAIVGEGGTAFIPVGSEDKLSWTNKDSYNHQDHKKGIVQTVWENTHIGDDLFGIKFKDVAPVIEAAGNIIGGIFAYGIPIGSLLISADGFTSDNDKAGRAALVRAGVSYAMSYGSGPSTSGTEQAANTATNAATNEGLSATAQVVQGVKDAASWFNSLKPVDFGINFGNAAVDKIVFNAAKGAIASAVKSGLSGQDFEDAVKAAITSAAASLVGGAVGTGTQKVTGSNLAGNVAGTVAGDLTGKGINNALADDPQPVTRPTVTRPAGQPTTTPTATTGSKYTGNIARMIWS